jgi:hypothetical protein
MEKDYGPAIRGGFEATGINPFNMDRVLSKLPKVDREVTSNIQQQLLNKLGDLRYNPAKTTQAQRPKKKEKLPAGASYTCAPEGGVVGVEADVGEARSVTKK